MGRGLGSVGVGVGEGKLRLQSLEIVGGQVVVHVDAGGGREGSGSHGLVREVGSRQSRGTRPAERQGPGGPGVQGRPRREGWC